MGKLGYGVNSTVWLSRDLKYVLDFDVRMEKSRSYIEQVTLLRDS